MFLIHKEQIFFLCNFMHFRYLINDVFQVIILIGNKADLEAQRDVTYEEAKQFAEENGERAEKRWNVRYIKQKQEIRLTLWPSLLPVVDQVCCF